MWSGHYFTSRGVANCCSQHQHVHLRDCPCLHTHGAWVPEENERDHRVTYTPFLLSKILFLILRFENGDSILAPGGSVSNMYALMIARHKIFPQHKKYGMRAIKGQLIMYTSQHVRHLQLWSISILIFIQHHYSIKGGASAIGLGTDNCVQVACDER